MPDEEDQGPGRAAPEALETGAASSEAKVGSAIGRVEPRSRVSVPETAALFGVLVVLFVFFALTAEFFFNSNNIVNILQNVARAGIIACPATILLIAGQFDLSVGSTAAFVGMAMAVFASDPETAKTPFALGLLRGDGLRRGDARGAHGRAHQRHQRHGLQDQRAHHHAGHAGDLQGLDQGPR